MERHQDRHARAPVLLPTSVCNLLDIQSQGVAQGVAHTHDRRTQDTHRPRMEKQAREAVLAFDPSHFLENGHLLARWRISSCAQA